MLSRFVLLGPYRPNSSHLKIIHFAPKANKDARPRKGEWPRPDAQDQDHTFKTKTKTKTAPLKTKTETKTGTFETETKTKTAFCRSRDGLETKTAVSRPHHWMVGDWRWWKNRKSAEFHCPTRTGWGQLPPFRSILAGGDAKEQMLHTCKSALARLYTPTTSSSCLALKLFSIVCP